MHMSINGVSSPVSQDVSPAKMAEKACGKRKADDMAPPKAKKAKTTELEMAISDLLTLADKRYEYDDDLIEIGDTLVHIISKLSKPLFEKIQKDEIFLSQKNRFFKALDSVAAVVQAFETIRPSFFQVVEHSYDTGKKQLLNGLELACKIDPSFKKETLTDNLFPEEFFQLIRQNNIGSSYSEMAISSHMKMAKPGKWIICYATDEESEESLAKWEVRLKQSGCTTKFKISATDKETIADIMREKAHCLSREAFVALAISQ
jgi:hypothetical protein